MIDLFVAFNHSSVSMFYNTCITYSHPPLYVTDSPFLLGVTHSCRPSVRATKGSDLLRGPVTVMLQVETHRGLKTQMSWEYNRSIVAAGKR